MITNTDPISIVRYRGFQIHIDSEDKTTALSWWHPHRDYVGYQVVDTPEWSDGELLRYAMDNIDRIWTQWNRIEYQITIGKDEV